MPRSDRSPCADLLALPPQISSDWFKRETHRRRLFRGVISTPLYTRHLGAVRGDARSGSGDGDRAFGRPLSGHDPPLSGRGLHACGARARWRIRPQTGHSLRPWASPEGRGLHFLQLFQPRDPRLFDPYASPEFEGRFLSPACPDCSLLVKPTPRNTS